MPSGSNSSSVIKTEQNNKQKRRRYGVENKIKTTSNVGSVIKIESRLEAFDEVKKRKSKLFYLCELEAIKTNWRRRFEAG